MSTFANRILRAAKLDRMLYEEVEADTTLTGQAVGVVILSSIAAGLGSIERSGISGIWIGTVSALVGWYVWAYVTYFIGTRLLPEPQTRADHGQLLRTLGFASAPGMIRILGLVPRVSGIAFFVASIWMLIAMVIAVKQALDYESAWRALGVCAIGWAIQMLILVVFFLIFAGAAATGIETP